MTFDVTAPFEGSCSSFHWKRKKPTPAVLALSMIWLRVLSGFQGVRQIGSNIYFPTRLISIETQPKKLVVVVVVVIGVVVVVIHVVVVVMVVVDATNLTLKFS